MGCDVCGFGSVEDLDKFDPTKPCPECQTVATPVASCPPDCGCDGCEAKRFDRRAVRQCGHRDGSYRCTARPGHSGGHDMRYVSDPIDGEPRAAAPNASAVTGPYTADVGEWMAMLRIEAAARGALWNGNLNELSDALTAIDKYRASLRTGEERK